MAERDGHWERSRNLSLSRRSLLGRAALGSGGLALALAAGCSESKPSDDTRLRTSGSAGSAGTGARATAVAKQPKRGGTIVHKLGDTLEAFSSGFDPHVLNGAYTSLMGLFYQNLVSYNQSTLDPEPEIAQKWEQPDPATWVFHLAPGIKWHNKPPVNGRALTAADVLYSLERVRTNDPKFINRALFASIDQIQATDDATLRLTTKGPDVTVLANLADVSVVVVAREVFDKGEKPTTAEQVIGTGAFVLQNYQPNVGATLVRNPAYWKPGLPYLDGMKLQNMLDAQAAFAAFLAGQLDITIIPGQESKKFLADQANKYTTGWAEDLASQIVWMNTQKKPFDDPRVVRAFRLLVDHNEVIPAWAEAFYGRGTLVGSGHLPGILKSWDFSEDQYKQAAGPAFLEWKQPKDDAIKEALALLNAGGHTKDNPIKVEQSTSNNTEAQSGAQLLQAQYKRFSQGIVQTDLRFVETVQHIALLAQGNFELGGPAARGGFTEPDQALRQINYSKGSLNFGKWNDPQADALIDKQRGIFDVQQRRTAVKEALTYLMEHAPYTGWVGTSFLNAAQNKVKGFAPEHRSRFRGNQYEYIWLDA
jgi:peptide/nickel transport system substrate-binding protein